MKKIIFIFGVLMFAGCFSAEYTNKEKTITIEKKGGKNDKYYAIKETHNPWTSSLKCEGEGSSEGKWMHNPNEMMIEVNGITVETQSDAMMDMSVEAMYAEGVPVDSDDNADEFEGVLTLNEVLYDASRTPLYVYRTASWKATSISNYSININVKALLNPIKGQ